MKRYHLLIAIVFTFIGCASRVKTPDAKPDRPKLLKPVVKKIWIPPEIKNDGSEWVEGHYMYRIERETTWSR